MTVHVSFLQSCTPVRTTSWIFQPDIGMHPAGLRAKHALAAPSGGKGAGEEGPSAQPIPSPVATPQAQHDQVVQSITAIEGGRYEVTRMMKYDSETSYDSAACPPSYLIFSEITNSSTIVSRKNRRSSEFFCASGPVTAPQFLYGGPPEWAPPG